MTHIDDTNAEVRRLIDEIWNKSIGFCYRVLRDADVYGFSLMEIPEPNVHQLERLLSVVIIPLLTHLIEEYGNLEPEDGIRLANIRQYSQHLKDIVQAIKDDNEEAFEAAVATLDGEAMFSA